ncbi:MAG: acyl-CoA reductase, partial [Flavobacteriales bacterium]|nr:acyl-CoA reductase [Flavobacteriales bacterium]
NIIRKSRSSLAVLNGDESQDDYIKLGKDIFQYYGLGCRNVSKILVPHDYNRDRFFEGIASYENVINHNKYGNNYDYNRTMYLMSQVDFYDNGFLMLKEDEGLSSPISILYIERYKDQEHLNAIIERHGEDIQCIVSSSGQNSIGFGDAQNPSLADYADDMNTLEFLVSLTPKS